MKNPLTKAQEALRGRQIADMTEQQLRLWIDACDRMEVWSHTPAKARRGWKRSREVAADALQRFSSKR
jgi:hypothetical protein